MLDTTQAETRPRLQALPAPATVLAVDVAAHRVQVQPLECASDGRLWCRMAAPGIGGLRPGDEVLVVTGRGREAYVIGVLGEACGDAVCGDDRELRLPGGARAVAAGGERIGVYGEGGELLFEYDAASGRARLRVPRGGLEIAGDAGDVAITTGGRLRLAAHDLQVETRAGAGLTVLDPQGRAVSGLRLTHRGAHLFGRTLEVLAGRAKLLLGELVYRGRRAEATLERLQTVAERVESTAKTVVARADDVYRTVRGLTQLRSGRLRTEVEDTAHLRAARVDVRARGDVAIDGERIHLG